MAQHVDGGRELPSLSHGSPLSPRLLYWVAFCVLGSAMLLWSVANPPMAAPDEPAHVVRAAAVVRGEVTGAAQAGEPGSAVVEVPALYAYAMSVPTCFAFQSNVTAACMPGPPQDLDDATTVSTWVARNNPLYYAVVGLPTVLPESTTVFLLMRATSAVLCALVLAWGFRALAELSGARWVALGLLGATTPMVLFLGSTVNPSGLEVSSAIALWVSLLTLARSPDPTRLPTRVAGVAVLAVLLANSGNVGPVFLVAIVLAVALTGPRHGLAVAARDRRSRPWIVLAVAGFLASLAWAVGAGVLGAGGSGGAGGLGAAARSLLASRQYVTSMIGEFGWADTPLPQWLYLLLVLGIGFPVVLGLLLAPRRRDAVAILGVGALALGLPAVLQGITGADAGWQGRYSLPLMVGVPIVAGFVARTGSSTEPALSRRSMLLAPAAVLVVGHVAAYAVNLHRYVRGTGGSWIFPTEADWQPPLPALLLLTAYAAVLLAGLVLLDRATRAAQTRALPATAEPIATEAAR